MRAARAYQRIHDAQLIALVTERDAGALDVLFDRYGAIAHALAHAILRDEALAVDVVQSVFVALWRDAGRFDAGRGMVAARLLSVTRQLAVERLHRLPLDRRPGAATSKFAFEADDLPGDRRRTKVRQAVGALPERDRRMLALTYLGGYTQREVATLVDAPLEMVRSQTSVALRTLRHALVDHEGELDRWSRR